MGGALLLAFYYKKGPYCCWGEDSGGVGLRVEGGKERERVLLDGGASWQKR